MRRTTAILFAIVLSTAAGPSLAAWDRVGSVDFSVGDTHGFQMGAFNGNVMGLTAHGSNLICDRVTATFADGSTRAIFKGNLPQGEGIRVDLPPGSVDGVNFNCRPAKKGDARVDIAADTGVGENTGHS